LRTEVAVIQTLALALALAAPGAKESAFPLRTDPTPKEWRIEEINDGLPYRWEKGAVHVLAWETVADDRPHEYTQVLVLKRFDRPTENGGHRWVLAQLYRDYQDQKRPWGRDMRIPPPALPGKPAPQLPDAWVFGHEFYDQPPTDDEIKTFLEQTMWAPSLGTEDTLFISGERRKITTKLAAGGVDRAAWKKVIDRDVPTKLFPELTKAAEDKK